jgi:hypothetical protein
MPNIYLLQDSGDAVELSEQPYNSEDILQRLLAEHPDILGGDQIGGGRPRRWLFVAREAGIPSEEAGADRWSLDHLFVDQDGTPTLVEVKRSSDTRIRREVVEQKTCRAASSPDWLSEQFDELLQHALTDAQRRTFATSDVCIGDALIAGWPWWEDFTCSLPARSTFRPTNDIQEIEHDIQPGKRGHNIPPRNRGNWFADALTKRGGHDEGGDEGVPYFSLETCRQDSRGLYVERHLIPSGLTSLQYLVFDNIIRCKLDKQISGGLA